MMKKLVRSYYVFMILAILIAQLGLVPNAVMKASAAPAQDAVPPRPSFAGVTISNVQINGGGNSAFLAPGSTFTLSLDYSIVDAGCPGCIDEITIGFSTISSPFSCIYLGIPGVAGTSGSASINVTLPSTPGVYYFGFDRAQQYTCQDALSGW